MRCCSLRVRHRALVILMQKKAAFDAALVENLPPTPSDYVQLINDINQASVQLIISRHLP